MVYTMMRRISPRLRRRGNLGGRARLRGLIGADSASFLLIFSPPALGYYPELNLYRRKKPPIAAFRVPGAAFFSSFLRRMR